MKSLASLSLGIALVTLATPAFTQQTLTFDPKKAAADYADNLKSKSFISITEEEGTGVLSFRSDGGGELISLNADGQPINPGDFVEIELRCAGELTLGVFLRGGFIDDPAYMAFFSASPDHTVRLSLTKTFIESGQRPSEGAFAQAHIRDSRADDWMKLRFEVEEVPDVGIALRASILDHEYGDPILEIDGVDLNDLLQPGGILFLRFFANRTEGKSQLDIRSITYGKQTSE
jgi:hypothetical protein